MGKGRIGFATLYPPDALRPVMQNHTHLLPLALVLTGLLALSFRAGAAPPDHYLDYSLDQLMHLAISSASKRPETIDDIPAKIQIANTYQPTPKHRRIYDELFAEFVNIYKQNRKTYARLNRD